MIFLQTSVVWMGLRHRKTCWTFVKPALDSIFFHLASGSGGWNRLMAHSTTWASTLFQGSKWKPSWTSSVTHLLETCMPPGRLRQKTVFNRRLSGRSRGQPLTSLFPSCYVLIGTTTFELMYGSLLHNFCRSYFLVHCNNL